MENTRKFPIKLPIPFDFGFYQTQILPILPILLISRYRMGNVLWDCGYPPCRSIMPVMQTKARGDRRTEKRKYQAALLVGLFAGLFAFSLTRLDLMTTLERQTMDMRFRALASRSEATDRIVVVDIDEKSIEALEPDFGRWPWPRDAHAAVVEYLNRAGAKVIAFDVLFSERTSRREIDRGVWSALMRDAHALQEAPTRDRASVLSKELAKLDPAAGDDALAQASAAAGKVLYAMIFREDNPAAMSDTMTALLKEKSLSQTLSDARSSAALGERAAYSSMTLPLSDLAAASAGLGHTNLHPDPDGPARSTFPILGCGDVLIPSLPVAAASLALGSPISSIRVEPGRLVIADRSVPLDEEGRMDILYQGGDSVLEGRLYKKVSYADVLLSYLVQGTGRPPPVSPECFRDKIVLIGTSATGLFDLRATPFSAVTPGVEIHCHVLDDILAGRFLVRPPSWIAPLLILALSLAVAILGGHLRPLIGLLAAAGLILLHVLTAALLFRFFNLALDIASPVLGASLSYMGIAVYRYRTELRNKQQIRGMMGKYVPAAVMEEILANPEKLKLGGERRTVSILFSDVVGFTTLSDQLPPEEVALLLNEYLTMMTECVFANEGTLDKFIGDAIMAEFGAPVEQPDHAARACRAAWAMRSALGRLHEKWRAEKKPVLECRIGIGTGEAIIGNMGSDQLFDYTAIGRIVNTAARLEPLCKDFRVPILVSDVTRKSAERDDAELVFREVALVRVKGVEHPEAVHELLGLRSHLDPSRAACLDQFKRALEFYRRGALADARSGFEAALQVRPEDGPAAVLLALCEEAIARPVNEVWTGVYEQKSK